MSADNGIYIAKFSDGYRVAYAAAIENIDYYPKGSKARKKELKNYFGNSKIYKTQKQAFKKAFEIEKSLNKEDDDFFYLEYGVCMLPYEYETF